MRRLSDLIKEMRLLRVDIECNIAVPATVDDFSEEQTEQFYNDLGQTWGEATTKLIQQVYKEIPVFIPVSHVPIVSKLNENERDDVIAHMEKLDKWVKEGGTVSLDEFDKMVDTAVYHPGKQDYQEIIDEVSGEVIESIDKIEPVLPHIVALRLNADELRLLAKLVNNMADKIEGGRG